MHERLHDMQIVLPPSCFRHDLHLRPDEYFDEPELGVFYRRLRQTGLRAHHVDAPKLFRAIARLR